MRLKYEAPKKQRIKKIFLGMTNFGFATKINNTYIC